MSPEAGWQEGILPAGENPQSVRNDLQDLVFAQHPELGEILRSFYEAGSTAASLSGSGSSLFGLFPSAAQARLFRESRDWGSFRVLECVSISRREYPRSLGLDSSAYFGSS
jgi:4-diphosphocytidyl-2C-methyl-D-erythritol kinase